MPETLRLDPGEWIIREVKRHVNRIGLVKHLRQSLAQKDWTSFVEIYGLPGVVVIAPPKMPADKEREYRDAADIVSEGGSGYLPHGASICTSLGPRGDSPFADFLRFLTEQLVLAGTGGLLTMLTASGSGTLAGQAHQETFRQIARSEARRISEVFQKQFDAEVLRREFPGQPVRAYFELAANEEPEVGELIDHALRLHQAGFAMDARQLGEKTGYRINGLEASSNPGRANG